MPLLKSKLSRPPINAGHVTRPRLIERLKHGLDSKLTLISAPAGYGKTTLLSAWAACCGLPVAWLTLDSGDDDPVRFVTYLVAALHSMGADRGQEMRKIVDALASSQPFNAIYWMSAILEQLEIVPDKFMLVLEDFHVIKNLEIHQAINFLLDHQPAQMHLVISTRVDPSLSIAKIRARGQLNELRQADLRFTPQETQAFVTQWIGSELLPGDLSTLSSRTEGWIAGLQMACLALQNTSPQSREEISRMVASFGGSHEYIVDFFATEILAQQTELVRSFLLQTSILDPLCGELCNVVTDRTDGQPMLEQLQKANLFVSPLDQERQWYRYHPLFSDLLRKQLGQEEKPEMVSELHQRASSWYESNELFDPAFQHACSAGDRSRVAWMVNEYSESLWKMGEYSTLFRWISNLSNEQLMLRPELIVAKAIILSDRGEYRLAKGLIAQVSQKMTDKISAVSAYQSGSELDEFLHPEHILGLVNVAAAHIACLQGEYERAIQKARQALDLLANFQLRWDIPWRCDVLISLSHALWLAGDSATALQHLSEAISLSKSYEHHQLFLVATTDQALFYLLQARFDQAAQVCQAGLTYINEHGLERHPLIARLLVIWGLTLCEQGNLEMTEVFLQQALALSQVGSDDTVRWFGTLALSRYWMAKGCPDKAETTWQEAQSLAAQKTISPWLSTILSQGLLGQAQLSKTKGIAAQGTLIKTRAQLAANSLVEPLSERECEVLRLLAEGLSNRQIAGRLYLSVRTVKFHTGNIYSKLGVKRRTEAIAQARTLGLLP